MQYEERIRALREDNDLNQTAVAKAIHVAQTTYSDYEKGKVRIPVECLIELAKFYLYMYLIRYMSTYFG